MINDVPIKLLVVDDHHVVRFGLKTLFRKAGRTSVIGEAGSVAEAVSEARRCQPDVVLMDVVLPDGSGVEACREIRSERPETRVIMLTSYADQDAIVDSILAGADGYILKQTDLKHLVQAVEIVAHGGSLLDPAVSSPVVAWLRRQQASDENDPLEALTEQERRILPYIAQGLTNRQIAATLFLSDHTVKGYVSNILQKLHLTRRSEAAAYIARYHRPSTSERLPLR